MSRRDVRGAKRRDPRAPARPGARAPRRRRASAVWIAAGLAAVIAVAWWWFGHRPPAAPNPAPADSLAAMPAVDAYVRGIALVRAGTSDAALPYMRRALAERPDLWQVHSDYASALVNASMESRSGRGGSWPVARSSVERVQLAREALERWASAESLAPDSAIGMVMEHRARLFAVTGFAWEARIDYARAMRTHRTPDVIRNAVNQLRIMQRASGAPP